MRANLDGIKNQNYEENNLFCYKSIVTKESVHLPFGTFWDFDGDRKMAFWLCLVETEYLSINSVLQIRIN